MGLVTSCSAMAVFNKSPPPVSIRTGCATPTQPRTGLLATFLPPPPSGWFFLDFETCSESPVGGVHTNLKTYLEYKERGVDTLRAHEKEIAELAEEEAGKAEEESE